MVSTLVTSDTLVTGLPRLLVYIEETKSNTFIRRGVELDDKKLSHALTILNKKFDPIFAETLILFPVFRAVS